MKAKTKIFAFLITIIAVGQIPLFSVKGLDWSQGRPQSTMLNVPYTRQVPLGKWTDPRQADGCEEATMIMAMAWVHGGTIPAAEAERDIINISEYERVIFGFYQDTSAQDTARVMKDFFQYKDIIVQENINTENIKLELASNRLVIIPIDPAISGFPMYKNGLMRHMVVAVGYDDKNDQIIIHDPFYQNGQNLWIPAANLNKALRNYDSGIHRSTSNGTALISVGRADILNE